jgi:hypothetical protein
VAFGTVISVGTKAHPKVIFEEDTKGWKGASPLLASFIMPTRMLTSVEPMEELNVYLSMKTTASTALFVNKLGRLLNIFEASLMDETAVHVLPEQPLPAKNNTSSSPTTSTVISPSIGRSGAAVVELDEQCELVTSLSCKVSVENDEVRALFVSGAIPQVTQTSACILNIDLAGHGQDVVFPFPVVGSLCKLRVARKSLYVEVNRS